MGNANVGQYLLEIWSTLLEYAKVVLPLLGVWLGYWLRGFENRTSDLKSSLDEIKDEIEELLKVGSSYWRRDASGKPQDAEDIALEAEIQGRNHAINALFESISHNFSANHVNHVRNIITDLRQTLTGGDFASAKGHTTSGHSIARSFNIASQLRVQLRASLRNRRRSLSFRG